ncbi:MAG TPA: hypothetical protein PKW95_00390 [bacterium]|nr:hypothetical protein [bacterium]
MKEAKTELKKLGLTINREVIRELAIDLGQEMWCVACGAADGWCVACGASKGFDFTETVYPADLISTIGKQFVEKPELLADLVKKVQGAAPSRVVDDAFIDEIAEKLLTAVRIE